MDIAEQNKAVIRRLEAITGGGDPSELDELCSPDIVNHALAPDKRNGREGTREFLASAQRNPGGSWLRSVVVAEDDFVIQFGVRQAQWPGRTFRGFDVPGGPYTADAVFIYRLVEGRIAKRWAVRDDLGMLVQLGALTPTAGVSTKRPTVARSVGPKPSS